MAARPLAEFVVLKFQPWGDSVLLRSLAWMQLDDIPKATATVEAWYFDSFAAAAAAVALWPDDGCTGVVPAAVVIELAAPR